MVWSFHLFEKILLTAEARGHMRVRWSTRLSDEVVPHGITSYSSRVLVCDPDSGVTVGKRS